MYPRGLRWTDPLFLACFQPALISSHLMVAFRRSFQKHMSYSKNCRYLGLFQCMLKPIVQRMSFTLLFWSVYPFSCFLMNEFVFLCSHNRFFKFWHFANCLVLFFFSSSRKCETLGYWSAMFSNNNDEDRPHQAYWVYGIFKKVWHLFTLSKNIVKLPSSSFDFFFFFVGAVFVLFPSHLFCVFLSFFAVVTICKPYPPAPGGISPQFSFVPVVSYPLAKSHAAEV